MSKQVSLTGFHEGYSPNSYKDTKGLWTWGYGWCLERRPLSKDEAMEFLQLTGGDFSPDDLMDVVKLRIYLDGLQDRHKYLIAGIMLQKDLDSAAESLQIKISCWWELNQPRRAALIDMAYNMGVSGLLAFKNTLAAMGEKKWGVARDNILATPYHKDTGARAERIAQMIYTGEWPDDIDFGGVDATE